MERNMKIQAKIKGALFVFALLLVPLTGYAATFRASENLIIDQNEVVTENMYAAAETLSVNGEIQEDAVVAGKLVTLSGRIAKDAVAAGETVMIHSPVGEDLRAAGGKVVVDSSIGGDAIVAGGEVTFTENARVSGDSRVFGGRVTMRGVVDGPLRIRGGIIELNGEINGTIEVHAHQTLVIGDNATIRGKLVYTAPSEATISQKANVPVIEFTKSDKNDSARAGMAALAGVFALVVFISTLLLSLLMVQIYPVLSRRVAGNSVAHGGKTTLIGLAATIITPLLAIVLIVSLIGLLAGFGLIAAALLLWILGRVFANILAGAILSSWIKKETITNWQWTVLGAVCLEALLFVPLLGWFVRVLVFFSAIGSLWIVVYESWWKNRKTEIQKPQTTDAVADETVALDAHKVDSDNT